MPHAMWKWNSCSGSSIQNNGLNLMLLHASIYFGDTLSKY
jgi:hypothetical protein